MRRGARLALGAVRLAVAAAIILAVAYVLSWQILYSGPVGNDTLFQLHLAEWVDSSFPQLHWWYRWDDHGIPYREGYPLAAHWAAAAVARLGSINLSRAMQLVQFAITPLGALGTYIFCAWCLRRPLAGMVAAVAYLLSPLTWTFLVDWGFYANQAGTVLFMPALIALDRFFLEWSEGRRGRKFRWAAFSSIAVTAVMGFVSPFLLGAVVAASFIYVLAISAGGWRSRARWLFVAAPFLLAGTFLLTAFWSLPQQEYLTFAASRVPPRAFDPALFQVWGLDQLFGVHPIRPAVLFDRMGLSLAVVIPAAWGALSATWNLRVRVVIGLVAFGVVTMSTTALDALTWGVPVVGYLVHARAGVTLVQFLVPVLAGIGVVETPAAVGLMLSALIRLGDRSRRFAASGLVAVTLALTLLGVGHFAHWVEGSPTALAYGDFQPSLNDVWARYPPGTAPATDLTEQLLPWAWRPLRVGCFWGSCATGSPLSEYRTLFASPPQRALVDAHVPLLLMDFHGLTGGGQAYTYNFQLPASAELDNWMLDSMLNRNGSSVKAELATAMGIDAVVLGSTQAARATDYRALGWDLVSSSPLTFVNPSPSGLATAWPAGTAVLVIGSDQRSTSHPYNDLLERATTGMIPYASGWLVRGQSPYVDDYSAADLARYASLLVVGYRYHDRSRAWGLLEGYVRGGGTLYIETGWQYVDPDWDLGSPAPSLLPISELRWGQLDPSAPIVVSGSPSPSWGSFSYGAGSGWGASSASEGRVRSGAEALVSVGGRVVVARWQLGRGRVVWSGMNLIAHSAGAGSVTEDQFVAGTFEWLLGGGRIRGGQEDETVTWVGDDQAQLKLTASTAPTWILFKESYAPGWSAELRWPDSPGIRAGSRMIPLLDGEMDFMLAIVKSVPAGSSLVFTYGPTALEKASWILSLVFLVVLITWMVRPDLLARGRTWTRTAAILRIQALAGRAAGWGRDDGAR